MCKNFASICKFEDAHLHMPHGKSALGFTMLSNLSVSEQIKLKSSRHKSMKTHARYQRITPENLEKKYEAMNPLLRSDSSSQDSVESPPKKKVSKQNEHCSQKNNKSTSDKHVSMGISEQPTTISFSCPAYGLSSCSTKSKQHNNLLQHCSDYFNHILTYEIYLLFLCALWLAVNNLDYYFQKVLLFLCALWLGVNNLDYKL